MRSHRRGVARWLLVVLPLAGMLVLAGSAGRAQPAPERVDSVRAWGANHQGQLGAPTTQSCSGVPCSRMPVAVLTLSKVVAVAAGESHNLAIVAEGPLPPTPTPQPTRPAAPSKLRRALKGRQVTLTWKDNATNESYVALERAIQAAPAKSSAAEGLEASTTPRLTYRLVKKLQRDAVSFRETLKPGTYYYRVRACNAVGCSKYAGPLKVTVT